MTTPINLVLNVPNYQAMVHYDWVNDFLKAEALKKQIADYKADLAAIKAAPVDNATFRERLRDGFEADRRERLERIAAIIGGLRSHGNAFTRLSMRHDSHSVERSKEIYPWADIEAAVDLIPEPPDAMSEKQREKAISKLEKKIADSIEKLLRVSPPEFFEMKNGKVVRDLRSDFVHYWRQRQQKCNAPIGPTGIMLAMCPRTEQAAYQRLDIHKGINKLGLDPSENRSHARISVWPAD